MTVMMMRVGAGIVSVTVSISVRVSVSVEIIFVFVKGNTGMDGDSLSGPGAEDEEKDNQDYRKQDDASTHKDCQASHRSKERRG